MITGGNPRETGVTGETQGNKLECHLILSMCSTSLILFLLFSLAAVEDCPVVPAYSAYSVSFIY